MIAMKTALKFWIIAKFFVFIVLETTRADDYPQSNCERYGKFWCSRSSKCVPAFYKCDAYKDCIFGEDEQNCTRTDSSPGGYCERQGKFWCNKSSNCLSTYRKCDSVKDCGFGEDEDNCPSFTGQNDKDSTTFIIAVSTLLPLAACGGLIGCYCHVSGRCCRNRNRSNADQHPALETPSSATTAETDLSRPAATVETFVSPSGATVDTDAWVGTYDFPDFQQASLTDFTQESPTNSEITHCCNLAVQDVDEPPSYDAACDYGHAVIQEAEFVEIDLESNPPLYDELVDRLGSASPTREESTTCNASTCFDRINL